MRTKTGIFLFLAASFLSVSASEARGNRVRPMSALEQNVHWGSCYLSTRPFQLLALDNNFANLDLATKRLRTLEALNAVESQLRTPEIGLEAEDSAVVEVQVQNILRSCGVLARTDRELSGVLEQIRSARARARTEF